MLYVILPLILATTMSQADIIIFIFNMEKLRAKETNAFLQNT
jgi:hypothetical protein